MTTSPSSNKQSRLRSQGRDNGAGLTPEHEAVQDNPDQEVDPSSDHHEEFMAQVRESFERNDKLYELLAE